MQDIAKFIDHTSLKPDATHEQIKTLCEEANKYKFKSVCINTSNIAIAKKYLDNDVLICTVIGFPLGAMTTEVKAFETQDAIKKGAKEIDMVLNIARLIDGDDQYVESDIRAVVQAAGDIPVKVIFETCLLNEQQIRTASRLSISAGAKFIKTSTGFSTSGSNKEVVAIMLEEAAGKCDVKASGGVRTFEVAKEYIGLGVKRLGTSSGIAIMNGKEDNSSTY